MHIKILYYTVSFLTDRFIFDMLRRTFLSAMGAAAFFGTSSLYAQSAAERVLTVPFPAGGGGDTLARSSLDVWAEALGAKVVPMNRPGAGGNIGIRALVNEKKADFAIGYVTNGIYCTNPVLYRNMGFDPKKDLRPIGQLSSIALLMVLNPNAVEGVTDFRSLVEYAKAHPGEMNFASSGIGTTSHVAGELLAREAGIDLTHIPHVGGAAAVVEVLSGRIPFMIDVMPNLLQHVKSGALLPLGVTTAARQKQLPDVPTLKELGVSGYELFAWDGFVCPASVSDEAYRSYLAAMEKVQENPQVALRLETMGAEPSKLRGEAFEAFIDAQRPKWQNLIRRSMSANEQR